MHKPHIILIRSILTLSTVASYCVWIWLSPPLLACTHIMGPSTLAWSQHKVFVWGWVGCLFVFCCCFFLPPWRNAHSWKGNSHSFKWTSFSHRFTRLALLERLISCSLFLQALQSFLFLLSSLKLQNNSLIVVLNILLYYCKIRPILKLKLLTSVIKIIYENSLRVTCTFNNYRRHHCLFCEIIWITFITWLFKYYRQQVLYKWHTVSTVLSGSFSRPCL